MIKLFELHIYLDLRKLKNGQKNSIKSVIVEFDFDRLKCLNRNRDYCRNYIGKL